MRRHQIEIRHTGRFVDTVLQEEVLGPGRIGVVTIISRLAKVAGQTGQTYAH